MRLHSKRATTKRYIKDTNEFYTKKIGEKEGKVNGVGHPHLKCWLQRKALTETKTMPTKVN